jgi:hypothetical protein
MSQVVEEITRFEDGGTSPRFGRGLATVADAASVGLSGFNRPHYDGVSHFALWMLMLEQIVSIDPVTTGSLTRCGSRHMGNDSRVSIDPVATGSRTFDTSF